MIDETIQVLVNVGAYIGCGVATVRYGACHGWYTHPGDNEVCEPKTYIVMTFVANPVVLGVLTVYGFFTGLGNLLWKVAEVPTKEAIRREDQEKRVKEIVKERERTLRPIIEQLEAEIWEDLK